MASFEELKALVDAGDTQRLLELGMPRTLIGREDIFLYGYNPETGKAFTPGEQQSFGEQNNAGYKKVGNKTYGPGDIIPGESLQEYAARFSEMGGGQFGYKGKSYQMNRRGQFYEIGTPEPADFTDTEENLGNLYYGSTKQIQGAGPAKIIDPTKGKVIGYDKSGNLVYEGSTTPIATRANADGSVVAGSTGSMTNPFAPGSDAAKAWSDRKSAYDLLYSEFDKYGLSSLVTPLKELITSGASPSEFTIRIRETDAYKKRFAANETRIKNGLRALSEAEYIRNEDNYQEVMRRRGLPPEYYAKGDLGVQKGFDALLAGDVSSAELEDRIVTAQDRVLNANPEIAATLKQFYPGISNGDILAYALDPTNAINQIKRKITAAEIGAAAGTYGLGATVGRAEQLAGAGVTEATALQGFKTISQVGPRAGVLAQYYKQDPYTQETAEKEFFGLTGAREAEMQRKKLTELETRAFQGSAGAGAIARDRAGVL